MFSTLTLTTKHGLAHRNLNPKDRCSLPKHQTMLVSGWGLENKSYPHGSRRHRIVCVGHKILWIAKRVVLMDSTVTLPLQCPKVEKLVGWPRQGPRSLEAKC